MNGDIGQLGSVPALSMSRCVTKGEPLTLLLLILLLFIWIVAAPRGQSPIVLRTVQISNTKRPLLQRTCHLSINLFVLPHL